MIGTLAETLLPAIEQLTEAVRAVDASVTTSFWDIWGPSFLTLIGTLIFACIAIRSLRAAKEANKIAVHLNFKNKLLENFQAISSGFSGIAELIIESKGKSEYFDQVEKSLSNIVLKLTEGYYFFTFFTTSYKYIHVYSLLILNSKQKDSNWLDVIQNEEEMFYRPPSLLKRIEQIFHDIAQLSQEELSKRQKLEVQSFSSFSQSNCRKLDYKEQFDVLAKAMESLRKFQPYDFNQDTKSSSCSS